MAKAPDGSRGLLGDLGGTGGGTRVLDPGGLSHRTAGRLRVSAATSSELAEDAGANFLPEEEPSGETGPETGLAGKPEVDADPSGE